MNLFTVINLPNDDCDILVEHLGNQVINVTDCEGGTLKPTEKQLAFIADEITKALDKKDVA